MTAFHVPHNIATRLLAAGAMVLWLHAAQPAHAAPATATQDARNSTGQTAKKSRSVKVKHQQNHSGESTAERDRRLQRECQGLPNAGACLGYKRR